MPVADGAHPFTKFLFKKLDERGISISHISEKAGVCRGTLHAWKRGARDPGLSNMQAVLNALGYEIEIVIKI